MLYSSCIIRRNGYWQSWVPVNGTLRVWPTKTCGGSGTTARPTDPTSNWPWCTCCNSTRRKFVEFRVFFSACKSHVVLFSLFFPAAMIHRRPLVRTLKSAWIGLQSTTTRRWTNTSGTWNGPRTPMATSAREIGVRYTNNFINWSSSIQFTFNVQRFLLSLLVYSDSTVVQSWGWLDLP